MTIRLNRNVIIELELPQITEACRLQFPHVHFARCRGGARR